MLEKSFGLLFFLKQPQNYKSGPMYIYMRITVDGVIKELSTKRLWEPSRWNAKAAKATGNKEDVKTLNTYLETLRTKVYDATRILLDSNKQVTAEAIKNFLSGKSEGKRMIMDVFKEHNDEVKALVGHEFAPGTLERYHTSFDHTRSFIKWKYGVDDMDINKLNYEFISAYACWLKTVRQCSHNTTMKYLSNFKKIVLHCVHNGWLTTGPFCNFKMTKKEIVRMALTETKLQILTTKTFKCERLNYVKNIFLFSCYTGLAYI